MMKTQVGSKVESHLKIIVATAVLTILILLRFPTLLEMLEQVKLGGMGYLLDIAIIGLVVGIVINEKWTRGERWKGRHIYVWICLTLALAFIWLSCLPIIKYIQGRL